MDTRALAKELLVKHFCQCYAGELTDGAIEEIETIVDCIFAAAKSEAQRMITNEIVSRLGHYPQARFTDEEL